MRIVNENFETIDEAEADLSKGYLIDTIAVREDAEPIDNVIKWAWTDDDYETVKMYRANEKEGNPAPSPQDDMDGILVDHEYRLTLLELGIYESEV